MNLVNHKTLATKLKHLHQLYALEITPEVALKRYPVLNAIHAAIHNIELACAHGGLQVFYEEAIKQNNPPMFNYTYQLAPLINWLKLKANQKDLSVKETFMYYEYIALIKQFSPVLNAIECNGGIHVLLPLIKPVQTNQTSLFA